jgi:hypothetical protein
VFCESCGELVSEQVDQGAFGYPVVDAGVPVALLDEVLQASSLQRSPFDVDEQGS